jgi:hypothetical protein
MEIHYQYDKVIVLEKNNGLKIDASAKLLETATFSQFFVLKIVHKALKTLQWTSSFILPFGFEKKEMIRLSFLFFPGSSAS